MPKDDTLQLTLTRGEAQLLLDYATLGSYYANDPGVKAIIKPEEQLANVKKATAKGYQPGFSKVMQRLASWLQSDRTWSA